MSSSISDPALAAQVKAEAERQRAKPLLGEMMTFGWILSNLHLAADPIDVMRVRDLYWTMTGLSEPPDHLCVLRQLPGLRAVHQIAAPWPHIVAVPDQAASVRLRAASAELKAMGEKVERAIEKGHDQLKQDFIRPVGAYLKADGLIAASAAGPIVITSAHKFKAALDLNTRPTGATWNRCGARVVEEFLRARTVFRRELDKHGTEMMRIAAAGFSATYASWDSKGVGSKWQSGATTSMIRPPALPPADAVMGDMLVSFWNEGKE